MTQSIDFIEDTSFTLDFTSVFTDSDIATTYQPITSFKVYISTSNSDKTLKPSYLTYQSQTLDASEEVTITYSHTLGNAGTKNLYVYIEDPYGAIINKSFTLTIQGCSSACAVDQCTAVNDEYSCDSCNTGYSSYYDSDSEAYFCGSTCNLYYFRVQGGACAPCN